MIVFLGDGSFVELFSYLYIGMSGIKSQLCKRRRDQERSDSPYNFPPYMYHQVPGVQYPVLPPWRKPQGSSQQYQAGKWTNKEQRIYINFIQNHLDQLKDKQNRKASKIFKKMSEAVKTRNADQCRSHHQKLSQYYASTEDIIKQYKAVFEQRTGSSNVPAQHQNDGGHYNIQGLFYTIEGFKNSLKITINADSIMQYEP